MRYQDTKSMAICRKARVGVGLAAIVALLAIVPAADAYVYWQSADGANSRVGRALLNGASPNPSFITGNYFANGVASSGRYVFWGNSGNSPTTGRVGRANVDGTGVDQSFRNAGTLCGVFAVAANATHVYWMASDCGATRFISRSDTEGGQSASSPLVSGLTGGCGIAIDDNYLYWSAGRFIGRALLDGSDPDPTWLDIGAGLTACGLAVDATHIYYTIHSSSGAPGTKVGRATIDDGGSVNNSFVTGASFSGDISKPSGLAVDDTYVYWTNQPAPGGTVGSIGRMTKAETGLTQSFVPNVFQPQGLAVDALEPGPDADGDGMGDATDNCPELFNPDQADNDADGQGNSCDADDDNDGRLDSSDNCSTLANPDQANADVDALGNVCDPDDDNDAVADSADNCPWLANADQTDADLDRVGRACDSDDQPQSEDPPPPPLLAAVSISQRRFTPSKQGAVFSFVLDPAALVTIAIQRRVKGKWLTKHTLRREARSGMNKVRYTGRVRGKALRRGRYRARFVATASGVKSGPRSVGFRIVRDGR